VKPTGGVMAAGKGSRIASRGFKPLLEVNGETLFERTLSYFSVAGIERVFVAAGANRDHLSEFSKSLSPPPQCTILAEPKHKGTASALAALLPYANADGIVISTIDTVASRHIIRRLLEAVQQMRKCPQAVVVTTTFIHDVRPIWVKHEASIVLKMSKAIAATGMIFGNVRWLSKESCTFLIDQGDLSVEKDVHLMDQLIARFPSDVRLTREEVVYDIDTPKDIGDAFRWASLHD
jgi:NDP-sugar pyrophosphorylase family protein